MRRRRTGEKGMRGWRERAGKKVISGVVRAIGG